MADASGRTTRHRQFAVRFLFVIRGSPLLVSPEMLRALDGRELRRMADLPAEYVDVQRSAQQREQWLRAAFERFDRVRRGAQHARFEDFCARNRQWLDDFALFSALKRAHAGSTWTAWGPDVRRRRGPALARARRRLAGEVRYQHFIQYEFDRQWRALRCHCHDLGVGLIGDRPLFVAADRADVNPELFRVDRSGRPRVVAGTPPDYFSHEGQRWDNPVYRWDVLRRQRYAFWRRRLRASLDRFDVVRLDHFIGFHRYWEVPARARTARHGRSAPGPGADFFVTMQRQLRELPFIAEDLGVVTPEVTALRDRFTLPGCECIADRRRALGRENRSVANAILHFVTSTAMAERFTGT